MTPMHPTPEEFASLTDGAIASLYGRSVRTVQRWRRRFSPSAPAWGPGKLSCEKARAIRTLYSQGMTQSAIGEIYGVTQAAVGRVVNDESYRDRAVGFTGESQCQVEYRVF